MPKGTVRMEKGIEDGVFGSGGLLNLTDQMIMQLSMPLPFLLERNCEDRELGRGSTIHLLELGIFPSSCKPGFYQLPPLLEPPFDSLASSTPRCTGVCVLEEPHFQVGVRTVAWKSRDL